MSVQSISTFDLGPFRLDDVCSRFLCLLLDWSYSSTIATAGIAARALTHCCGLSNTITTTIYQPRPW